MFSVEETVRLLQEQVKRIEKKETISLLDGLGRILAEDEISMMDQPPFPRSPLDGYAIRAEDSTGASKEQPVTLDVIGEVCAGEFFEHRLKEGQAVRIMTGAPIPDGANTVIRQENTDYGERKVRIYESLTPWSNYCPRGEDYKKGDVLLSRGTRLDSFSIGILASLGIHKIKVYEKPKIGMISTGDELLLPGTSLGPGKIYDSNLYLLGTRLKELGAEPVFLLHSADDPQGLSELIREKSKEVQMIVTTGGVSVGKKDILHEVIKILPARKLFWKVAVKPGSPTLAAMYENTLLLCLSGNPFGALVNFELLARPVIGALTGDSHWMMKKSKGKMANSFLKKSKGRRMVRGYYEDGQVRIPEKKHASGILSTMAGCNCLIDIEPGNNGLQAGDEVWIYLL